MSADRLGEIRGRLKNGAPPPAETIEGPHKPSTLNSERQWVASQIEQFGLRFVLVGAMLTSAKALPEHGSLAGWMWAVAERMGGLLLAREQDGADLAWLIGEVERLTADLDESRQRNVEVSKLATDWMVAHDSLKAGQPYKLPSPVPVAQLLATADAAGFARGVEAGAEVVFASSDLRVDELTPYGRDCREHAQRIRALLPRVTP